MLVSSIERIASVDPLAVLEHLVDRALVDDRIATLLEQGRAYWARPRDAFAIAAIGAVATLHPAGADRFAEVDASWRAFMRDAVVEGADTARGVGPLLMGGFAFDSAGPHTQAWSGFPASHLILPRFIITSAGNDSFLTINSLSTDKNESLASTVRRSLHESQSRYDMLDESVPARLRISDLHAPDDWSEKVSAAVNAIRQGDFEKVVLARAERAEAQHEFDLFSLLRLLKATHRDSFVFSYWLGDRVFAGASPELLARVDGRDVEASSLAGTSPRGETAAQDAANAQSLIGSEKDRAEHAAVRDALYADLESECESVIAPTEPSLLTLPHVHHLHTQLRGRLQEGRSLLDVVARLHPTPAVGGSPRNAALAFIGEYEGLDRGWYAGPVGWIDRKGGEFAVALRSAVVQGCQATLYAGCGIVADSDPHLELAESNLKFQLMESALARAASSYTAELASAAQRAS